MADFRKWLMAFAVITLLLGVTAMAQIPTTAPITCVAGSAPKQVRVEGVAELTGDVILNCTGGAPTPFGQPVPLANIRIALSSPITTRSLNKAGVAEAMLTIDEPYPAATPFPPIPGQIGAPTQQIGCQALGGQVTNNPYVTGTTGACEIAGKFAGTPVETYQGQYNTFQGAVTNGGLYIDFLGVPLDAPGSNYERVLRVTNLRADVTKVPVGQTVTATISIAGITSLTVPSPFTTVAFVYTGFLPGKVNPQNEVQCAYPGSSDAVGVTFSEGFATSFKTALITQADLNTSVGNLNPLRTDEAAVGTTKGWEWQDLLGTPVNYYTESGFTPNVTNPSALVNADPSGATPSAGDDSIGVADYGTRFLITINNLQNGVDLNFPAVAGGGTGGPNLVLYLVKNPNADGTGGTAQSASGQTVAGSWTPTSGATSSFVVYEVVSDDPNLQESVTINAGVTYSSSAINLGANIPALGADASTSTSTVTASFAPIAADIPGMSLLPIDSHTNSTTWGSLPRFIVTQSPLAAVILNPCSCNLLYPWIVSGSGFDTGLVVVNTSVSPTIWPHQTSQSGTVTLWFTGTRNGAAVSKEFHPNAANSPSEPPILIPAGCSLSLVMSLGSAVNCVPTPSGEGSISTAVTTGFVGYVIATTTFQYCHGVAYVSPENLPTQGSYYDAIELDEPFSLQHTGAVPSNQRTGQWGESQAH